MRTFTLQRLALLVARLPRETFYRHDVDVSLDAALAMARWETEREIHATYYLMATSPFYSHRAACVIGLELARLGHTVGVHIDRRVSRPPRTVDMPISYHCPTEDLLWQDVSAWENAYALKWKGAYYSDSRGRFSHGDPEDHPGPWPIQLNLHAEHWFAPGLYASLDPVVYEQFFYEPIGELAA